MEARLLKLEKLVERQLTILEFQIKKQENQDKAITKITQYIGEFKPLKDEQNEIKKDVNKLGGKVEQVFRDVSTKEALMQREINKNKQDIHHVVSLNKDELKSLLTNRLIWIIGVVLTGVVIIIQYFEGLHLEKLKTTTNNISEIHTTVKMNKDSIKDIGFNVRTLNNKIDKAYVIQQ